MRKDVKIGDRTVPFLSNGATVIYYRNIFKEDFLKVFNEIQEGNVSNAETVEPITRLAFTMNIQARAEDGDKDAKTLLRSGGSEDAYVEWLEGFNPLDIPINAEDILTVYTGNLDELESPKKG